MRSQWATVTHLVQDTNNIPTEKTTKFYIALKHKVPVVTVDWVKACIKCGTVQPVQPYLIRDPKTPCTQSDPTPAVIGPTQNPAAAKGVPSCQSSAPCPALMLVLFMCNSRNGMCLALPSDPELCLQP